MKTFINDTGYYQKKVIEFNIPKKRLNKHEKFEQLYKTTNTKGIANIMGVSVSSVYRYRTLLLQGEQYKKNVKDNKILEARLFKKLNTHYKKKKIVFKYKQETVDKNTSDYLIDFNKKNKKIITFTKGVLVHFLISFYNKIENEIQQQWYTRYLPNSINTFKLFNEALRIEFDNFIEILKFKKYGLDNFKLIKVSYESITGKKNKQKEKPENRLKKVKTTKKTKRKKSTK